MCSHKDLCFMSDTKVNVCICIAVASRVFFFFFSTAQISQDDACVCSVSMHVYSYDGSVDDMCDFANCSLAGSSSRRVRIYLMNLVVDLLGQHADGNGFCSLRLVVCQYG